VNNNFYEVLGIDKTASHDDIKKAFKKLAHQHHPDRNPGDSSAEVKFKDINEAYYTLSDDVKKASYDLRMGFVSHSNSSQPDFVRIMEEFERKRTSTNTYTHGIPWRGRGPVSTPQEEPSSENIGEDIEIETEITFNESINGCKKLIKIRGNIGSAPCSGCNGSGGQPGARTVTCSSCAGHGKGFNLNGAFSQTRKCLVCRGRGSIPLVTCKMCSGRGVGIYEKEINIKIPAGIENNQQLRIIGMGSPGKPPGDLYVTVKIAENNRYSRKGADIYGSVEISLKQAISGGNTSFEGLGGSINLFVPPGTQPGDEVRVPGFGVGTKGDFVACIKVSLPKIVSPRGQKLLDELYDELKL